MDKEKPLKDKAAEPDAAGNAAKSATNEAGRHKVGETPAKTEAKK
ncbi:hypothetical protein Sa4125_44180 [Aureimonas sp. SA4125]|nr:hypothetical protein [Aureimonas sp. SA4125]BDA86876.1 hypothetical protein Sa4125_44180 [Aureimonas sp. SA4125]